MKKYINLLLGLVFVLSVNLYLRTFTINFPQLKDQARQIVEQHIQDIATATVKKTYPDYSVLTQDKLAENFALQFKNKNQKTLKKQIQEEYAQLRSRYQDASGQTYLLEMDCWNWARYTQNILLFGHPGDKLMRGYNLDNLMLAPSGGIIMWNQFLFWLSAFIYRIFCLFHPVALFAFLFYLPLFYTAIFLVLLYLVISRYWGNLAAVIACLYVGLAPDFLLHSFAGWYDMDVLNFILPLLAVWAYARSSGSQVMKHRLLWVFQSAFWVGLFSFTWTGWWFLPFIILIYELFSLANAVCAYFQYHEKDFGFFKDHIFSLCVFVMGVFFWVIVFCGREPIVSIWGLITQALSLNKVLNVALWPNVYTTVSEISHIGLEEISEVSGSIVLFFMALIFLLLYFLGTIQSRKDPGPKRAFTIIMVFWFIGMYLACFSGRRFTVFLHIPLGFSLGVGVSGTLAYLKKKFKLPFGFLVLGLLIVLGGIDFANSYERARTIFPLMNSSWYKILTQLKNNSPADATIDSWWDYGDWFKAVAARRVIFDGQSQNTPQAYWMANCLLSDNEEESVRILKMLNNGGNRAYELINYGLKDPLRSVLLLKKLFSLKPETARLELSFLARPKVEEVMRLLFDRPPKAFFIVDNAMCDKMGSISYLGSWDFIKAYLAKRAEGADLAEAEDHIFKIKASGRKEIEKFSKEAALADQEDLGELVSQRFRIHSRLLSGQEKDGLVLFDKGFVFRPKEQLVYLYSPRLDRFRIPKSLFVFDNNQFKETPYPKNDLGLSLLVFKDKQEYRAVLLDRPLAVSLFSRLYFLNAAGLKHFKPFMEEKVADGVIRVFEIIWE